MLVLSRKPGEKVMVGNTITLTVVAISGKQVRVGIDTPDHVRILRAELASTWHDLMGNNNHSSPELAAAIH